MSSRGATFATWGSAGKRPYDNGASARLPRQPKYTAIPRNDSLDNAISKIIYYYPTFSKKVLPTKTLT